MAKSISVLTALLVLTTAASAVLVDGYCYLDGAGDHSGTKVLFTGLTPGAVTDSTYTDVNGYYLIDLVGAFYGISYFHEEYLPDGLTYQNFFSPVTLPDLILEYVGPLTEISGALNGMLEAGNYQVTGELIVLEGDSLIIEAGTALYFMGDYSFLIDGFLEASGIESDSIKFVPFSEGVGWGGIEFTHLSDDNSILAYCVIFGSNDTGIMCYISSPTITDCSINGNSSDYSGAGIYLYESTSMITNCMISGNITSGNGGGIMIHTSSPTINNCIIRDNTAGLPSHGGGMCVTSSSFSINKCLIKGNMAGFGGGIYLLSGNSITITNSTISSNVAITGAGGGLYQSNGDSLIIENCIFYGNIGNGEIYFIDGLIASVNFSDIYNIDGNGLEGNLPSLVGEIVTTNTNGDSCDAYYNIFADPQFIDPDGGDYHLSAESPCIDAGNPNSPLDPDGTLADIGAFFYNQEYIPNIEVISPVADDQWERGSTHDIVWNDNIPENVKIELYHGPDLEIIITDDIPSNGVYPWQIPEEGPLDNNFRVVIVSVLDEETYDVSDTFTLFVNNPPDVSVTITPWDNPVQIPAVGGSFRFDLALTNNDLEMVLGEFWTEAVLPSGAVYGPIIHLYGLTIGPGNTISMSGLEQHVPGPAQPGVYTYRVSIGVYPTVVIESDEFDFEKMGTDPFAIDNRGWEAAGWREAFAPYMNTSQVTQSLIPDDFKMGQPYPNPFNPAVTVSVALPSAVNLRVGVYNVNGREVAVLAAGTYVAGYHHFIFNGGDFSSGIYFIRATVPGKLNEMRKVVLVK